LSAGQREAILLLHGQPGSAHDWSRVIAALGDDVEAVAVERPGWDGRTAATGIAGNGAAAIAELDARGVSRAVVVGHSFGGAVAAWLAASRPDRVAGLVLAAPAANVASLYAVDRALAVPVVGDLASYGLLAAAGFGLGWAPLRHEAVNRFGLEDRYLRGLSRMLTRPSSWRAFMVEQRAMVRELPRLERELGRISAPTAVVYGGADYVVPAVSARGLADEIPAAELIEVPRAGHLLPHRHGERLAEIIVRVRASAAE
jgi:pimeloyl-ACP methyl ester carboxylesterase